MKFSIVFILGLFAITASATTELDLFAEVPEVQLIDPFEVMPEGFISYESGIAFPTYVTSYFQNIIDEMNTVLSAFKTIANNDKHDIEVLSQSIQLDAISKINEIMKKVQDLIAKGGKIGKCAANEEHAVMEITELVGEGIKVCAKDLIIALKELSGGIMGQSAELILNINQLKNIVIKCIQQGTVGQVVCITTNLNKGLKLLKQVISNAKTILSVLKSKSDILVNAAKNCNNNHIQVVYNKIKIVKSNVETCVKTN